MDTEVNALWVLAAVDAVALALFLLLDCWLLLFPQCR
jgi:hypothetical protein